MKRVKERKRKIKGDTGRRRKIKTEYQPKGQKGRKGKKKKLKRGKKEEGRQRRDERAEREKGKGSKKATEDERRRNKM